MAAYILCVASLALFSFQLCYAGQCGNTRETLPQNVIHDTGAAFYVTGCSRQTNCSACSDDDKSQIIQEASVCALGSSGTCSETPHDLRHSDHYFTVYLFGDQFDNAGLYDYKIEYNYSCNYGIESQNSEASLCSQGFGLTLRATDFKLRVIIESLSAAVDIGISVTSVSLLEGTSIALECSSGLENSIIDIPVHFVFIPDSNPKAETRMVCEAYNKWQEMNYNNGSWTVIRKRGEPYSCKLQINSISSNEEGTYKCVAILPHGILDWSERTVSIVLASKIDSPRSEPTDPTLSGVMEVIFSVVTSLLVITVIGICVVSAISYRIYKKNRPRNHDGQVAHGARGQGNQNGQRVDVPIRRGYPNYGATAGDRNRLLDPQQDEEVPGDNQPVPHEPENQVQVEVDPTSVTLTPGSLQSHHLQPPAGRGDQPADVPPVTVIVQPPPDPPGNSGPQSPTSTGGGSSTHDPDPFHMSLSEPGPTRHLSNSSTASTVSSETQAKNLYYQQTQLPPALGTTPDSDLPFDPNFTCPHCKKQYRVRQRQWFTRHMEECQAKNK